LFQLKTTNRQYYLLGPMVLSFLGYFYYNDCRIDSFQSREGFIKPKKPNYKNQRKLVKKRANQTGKFQKKNLKAKKIYKNTKIKYKEDMKIYDGNWKSLKKIIKDSVNKPEKPGETIKQASVEETTNNGINTSQYNKTTKSPQGPPI
jgi:outer membrane PBP1 activator LpoA protein